ncbi:MAG TPA: DUF2249 domain-containing protein [Opitutaceae bacterium]|nr:DUF2249 domain-containing protein [Opitutaceae bacterium]
MTNQAASSCASEELFDGRELPCETKRPAFLSRCCNLPVGRSFIFVNGHDPVPLRRMLDQNFPGSFRWEELDPVEPDAMRLRVTKLADPAGGFPPELLEFSCS